MRKRNEISIFQWTWNKRKRKPVKYFVKKICFQQKFRSEKLCFSVAWKPEENSCPIFVWKFENSNVWPKFIAAAETKLVIVGHLTRPWENVTELRNNPKSPENVKWLNITFTILLNFSYSNLFLYRELSMNVNVHSYIFLL